MGVTEHWYTLPRERLWTLHSWKYPKPNRTWAWTTCCRWTCFEQQVGWGHLQRCHPTSSILWCNEQSSRWHAEANQACASDAECKSCLWQPAESGSLSRASFWGLPWQFCHSEIHNMKSGGLIPSALPAMRETTNACQMWHICPQDQVLQTADAFAAT